MRFSDPPSAAMGQGATLKIFFCCRAQQQLFECPAAMGTKNGQINMVSLDYLTQDLTALFRVITD